MCPIGIRKRNGLTLIEVLITLVIVSFGLLAISAIIGTSLKNNQSAYYRSQAALLANDIIDRMRANRTTAEGANPSPYNLALGASPAATGVVQADLTDWRAALAAAFPSGTGSVSLDNVTKKVVVVVQWDDSRGAGGLTNQQTRIETRL